MQQIDDDAIVRRVLEGDRESYRTLVERHQARVYRCIRRVIRNCDDAEDLAQETFVRAFTQLSLYDSRWKYSTWITTIAIRIALNEARRNRSRTTQSLEDLPMAAEPVFSGSNPRDTASRREWLSRLRGEIEQLGERMQLVFGLRHEDDLSIAEIALVTESTPSAVKTQLHRARKILRERLRDYFEI